MTSLAKAAKQEISKRKRISPGSPGIVEHSEANKRN